VKFVYSLRRDTRRLSLERDRGGHDFHFVTVVVDPTLDSSMDGRVRKVLSRDLRMTTRLVGIQNLRRCMSMRTSSLSMATANAFPAQASEDRSTNPQIKC
jgi:hypothetical protein